MHPQENYFSDDGTCFLFQIGIALAVVVGGGAVGYIAGPGLVLIGILGEISATGFATGAALGATGAYISANAILNDQLVDSVYENALKWIVQVRTFNNLTLTYTCLIRYTSSWDKNITFNIKLISFLGALKSSGRKA